MHSPFHLESRLLGRELTDCETMQGGMIFDDLDPFPPRVAKTSPFIILLCLMPDDLLVKGEPLNGKELMHAPIVLGNLGTFFKLECTERSICGTLYHSS